MINTIMSSLLQSKINYSVEVIIAKLQKAHFRTGMRLKFVVLHQKSHQAPFGFFFYLKCPHCNNIEYINFENIPKILLKKSPHRLFYKMTGFKF